MSERTWHELRRTVSVHEPRIWVLESGECNTGDHEIVEVFIGTEAEADDRAAWLSAGRSALDEVTAIPYPVTTFEKA